MKFLRFAVILVFSVSMILFVNSCQTVRQVANALSNIQKLQFKLESVSGFSLAGIRINTKSSLKDFSITDGLKLTNAFATNSFPAEFILNVSARNPNDGKTTPIQTSATLAGLDWQLYIDGVPTIAGNIASPIEIPGTGQSVNIPLQMRLDLYQFFKSKGYENVVNLALALGGVKSSPSRLKLDAQPTVNTPFGPIVYPGRITIIDKQYN